MTANYFTFFIFAYYAVLFKIKKITFQLSSICRGQQTYDPIRAVVEEFAKRQKKGYSDPSRSAAVHSTEELWVFVKHAFVKHDVPQVEAP